VAKLDVSKLDVRGLGDYIREQRSTAQISLRQLATLAGVSNPYLSQIERGLRKPSAEILQQIAKALRISAEALYVQAGILEERYVDSDVPAAIFSDPALDERQKQVLLELYQSFRIENDPTGADESATAGNTGSDGDPTSADGPTSSVDAISAANDETAAEAPAAETPPKTRRSSGKRRAPAAPATDE
jgi:transcriptional regulator with XRE-family HTH domain